MTLQNPTTSRRAFIQAATWSAPAITIAAAAPAYATSTPPTTCATPPFMDFTALTATLTASNLSQDGQWEAGTSAATMLLALGSTARPALGFRGDAGVLITSVVYSLTVTMPWAINFDMTGTGWSCTRAGTTYTFTRDAGPIVPVAAATSVPRASGAGVVLPTSPVITGHVIAAETAAGLQMTGVTHKVTSSVVGTMRYAYENGCAGNTRTLTTAASVNVNVTML